MVLLHGLPGSRLCARPLAESARRTGLRLVTPERPGFGLSTPRPDLSFDGWLEDLDELAERLGLGRFSLLGVSAGGPFALAAAERLGSRLAGTSIVSGLGPVDRPESLSEMVPVLRTFWHLARRHPRCLSWLLRLYVPMLRRHPVALFYRGLDRHSRRLLAASPEFSRPLVEDLREGLRQGGRPLATEAGLLACPWSFDIARIAVPVCFWHGEGDGTCPIATARRLARTVPFGELRVLPDAGHLAGLRHVDEILEQLAA